MGVTKKYKWTCGEDFIDGTLRYTFDGRDPSDTCENISVIIYQEDVYTSFEKSKYYCIEVCNRRTETFDRNEKIKYLKDAKKEAEKLFEEYVKLFPED